MTIAFAVCMSCALSTFETSRPSAVLPRSSICLATTFEVGAVQASVARPSRTSLVLDHHGGLGMITELGESPKEWALLPNGSFFADELIKAGEMWPLMCVSHSAMATTYHFAETGSPWLTSATFARDKSGRVDCPIALVDRETGQRSLPMAVANLYLGDLGFLEVLDAGHVEASSGECTSLVIIRTSASEVALVDSAAAGTREQRTTPLGFVVPRGSPLKASFAITPEGRTMAALATAAEVKLYDLGDLAADGPCQPRLLATYRAGTKFLPTQTRLGIIRISSDSSDSSVEHRPALSIQEDCSLALLALEAGRWVTIADQRIPPRCKGMIEAEGVHYVFIDGRSVSKGRIGAGAVRTSTLK